ncbi:hypothetical protein HKL94_01960 [Candidatus Parcubacteria bacterium]|nr:hypothetical protein [Candidatus Parcubacteria bacterium]
MALDFFEKKVPKIVIKYGKLLDPIFIFYCQNNPELKTRGWNDWVPPPKEEMFKRVENYKKEWSRLEAKILRGICRVLDLSFKQNAIDVYIVSGNPRQLSDPIVIKGGFSSDEFVNSLAHELIHKLIQHNGEIIPISILDEMFLGETDTVRNHVVVHAVLKHIYLDVLKDEKRLERNVDSSKKHNTNDYSRAWEIVEKDGYMEIIKKFKSKIKRGLLVS